MKSKLLGKNSQEFGMLWEINSLLILPSLGSVQIFRTQVICQNVSHKFMELSIIVVSWIGAR